MTESPNASGGRWPRRERRRGGRASSRSWARPSSGHRHHLAAASSTTTTTGDVGSAGSSSRPRRWRPRVSRGAPRSSVLASAALLERLGDLVGLQLGRRQRGRGEHRHRHEAGTGAGDDAPRCRIARRLQAAPPAPERAAPDRRLDDPERDLGDDRRDRQRGRRTGRPTAAARRHLAHRSGRSASGTGTARTNGCRSTTAPELPSSGPASDRRWVTAAITQQCRQAARAGTHP